VIISVIVKKDAHKKVMEVMNRNSLQKEVRIRNSQLRRHENPDFCQEQERKEEYYGRNFFYPSEKEWS
jgi:hypothetical protein